VGKLDHEFFGDHQGAWSEPLNRYPRDMVEYGATPQGFNAGDQFFNYLKDTFDRLCAAGEAGDFMWLRAFCPQACYAAGAKPCPASGHMGQTEGMI
jgi:hypothetical protein